MAALDADERNRIIGENIRKYRLLKGLTQDELAEGICSVSQLSKVENGKTYIKRDLLRQMADRLSVTVQRIESTDALLDELTEALQWAKDARVAGNFDKSFEMTRDVISKSYEMSYYDLYTEAVILEVTLLNQTAKYDEAIERINQILGMEEFQISPTHKVQFLLELGRAYELNGNTVAAYDCFSRADDEFDLVEEYRDVRLFILFNLAKGHFWMRNDRTALRYTEKAQQLATELSKYLWRIRVTYTKALILERMGEFEKAEKIYLSSLKEAQENSLLLDVGLIHNNYGQLLKNREDYVQAKHHFHRAQKVYELLNEKTYLASSILHLAEVCHLEGDLDKATEYVEQALAVSQEAGSSAYQKKAKALYVYGKIELAKDLRDRYISYLNQALQVYDENQVVFEAYEVAVELADRLYEWGDNRAADYYRKAIEYNKISLEFGKRR